MREPYLNVTMILVCYFISWRPSLLHCLGTPLSSFRAGSIFGRGLLYPVNPEPVSNFHVKGSLMSRHYHRPLLRARADKILEWCHKKPTFLLTSKMSFFKGSTNGGKCKKNTGLLWKSGLIWTLNEQLWFKKKSGSELIHLKQKL